MGRKIDKTINFFAYTILLLGISTIKVSATTTPWTDTVGVKINGGDTLKKYALTGWGNAGAASQGVLLSGQNGWVKTVVKGINGTLAFGLTALNVSSNYTTMDFAIMVIGDSAYVYQRGVLMHRFGQLKNSDTLKVTRSGTNIIYMMDSLTLYTSPMPTSNPIVAASYTGSLEAVASLYTNAGYLTGISWSFSQVMFVSGRITPQYNPDSLGKTVLTTSGGHTPYQYIWNLTRYPFRNECRRFIDSINTHDSLSLDTTLVFHQYDSLRENNQNSHEYSSVNTIAVIDSNFDTATVNSLVGQDIIWMNVTSVSIGRIKRPRIVTYIGPDSLSPFIASQPNLSEPVTCYYDSGYTLTQTGDHGSGEAISLNYLPCTSYGKVNFVIPDSSSTEAIGLKIDTTGVGHGGMSSIVFGLNFHSGSLSYITNGSTTSLGSYVPGDMFSIENTFDTIHHLQRVILKQENIVIKIFYISRAPGTSGGASASVTRYTLDATFSTAGSSITNIGFVGWISGPYIQEIVQPASCGFPNSGSVVVFPHIPPGATITSYLWSNGATTANLTNVPPGQYTLTIWVNINHGPSAPMQLQTCTVGYKLYWANQDNAGPGNSNSIDETATPNPYVGGNSSNTIPYTTPYVGSSWISFDVDAAALTPPLYSGFAFGYSANSITFNRHGATGLALALAFYRTQRTYIIPHPFTTYTFYFIPVFDIGYDQLHRGALPILSGGAPNTMQLSYDNGGGEGIYLNNQPWASLACAAGATANYVVRACLNWWTNGTSHGTAFLNNGLCSFGCNDMNFQYSTLTKTLDGSYYLAPYNNLSFKYDEEYVTNNENLPYTIYDMGHNVIYSSTLSPANYKDNYYSIDLNTIPAVYNGYFILQVTNKKGEVTELRFKN